MRKHFDHVLKLMGIRRPTRSAKANGDPCARYEVLLSSYTDGMLDDRKTALVEGHLNACAACRASLAATRLMSGSFAHKPAPLFTGEMSARLRLALAAERERLPHHFPIFTAPRLTAVGAFAVLAVAFVVVSHGRHGQLPTKSDPTAKAGSTQVAVAPAEAHTMVSKSISAASSVPNTSTDANPASEEMVRTGSDISPTPIAEHTGLSGPKAVQPVAYYHPQFMTPTRNNIGASHPDVPAIISPTQPSPAPTAIVPSETPAIASVNIAPAPAPVPQAPRTIEVAMAPALAPTPVEMPSRPSRLMLASSVHLADRGGSGSSKIELARDIQIAQGSGTVSMVASDFH